MRKHKIILLLLILVSQKKIKISVEYIVKRLLPNLKKTCGWVECCPPTTSIIASPSNIGIAQPLGELLYRSEELTTFHKWKSERYKSEYESEKEKFSKIIIKVPNQIKPVSEQKTWKRLLLISSFALCCYHRKSLCALGKISLNYIKTHLGYS
jgi:hypothetical protein